jgi:hypothetical protein
VQLKRATPAWDKVQSRLRRQIGDEAWENLSQAVNQVTELLAVKGDSL